MPQAALSELQGIEQVYTVGAGDKVHVVNVTLGAQIGPNFVIKSGLEPGTQIILDNLQKLKEGAPVSPHPAAPPAGTTAAATPGTLNTNTDATGR